MNHFQVLVQLLALYCVASICVGAQTLTTAPAPAPGSEASCVLTTELEQGPFWLDDIMFRSNLTENQAGIPLLLRIKLVNSLTDCEPLADAFVDIWSCNSTGFYSGFTTSGGGGGEMGGAMAFPPSGSAGVANAPAGEVAPGYDDAVPAPINRKLLQGGMTGMGGMGGTSGTTAAEGISAEAAAAGQTSATTDDLTWLRGVQQTDEDGIVEFETIVPGWYAGRAPHIHIRVHITDNSTLTDEMAEFDDSHVAHTAQFFFDSALYEQVASTYPYTLDLTDRTLNSEDRVYQADPTAVLDISYEGSSITDGLVATITSVVDPSSTPSPGV